MTKLRCFEIFLMFDRNSEKVIHTCATFMDNPMHDNFSPKISEPVGSIIYADLYRSTRLQVKRVYTG